MDLFGRLPVRSGRSGSVWGIWPTVQQFALFRCLQLACWSLYGYAGPIEWGSSCQVTFLGLEMIARVVIGSYWPANLAVVYLHPQCWTVLGSNRPGLSASHSGSKSLDSVEYACWCSTLKEWQVASTCLVSCGWLTSIIIRIFTISGVRLLTLTMPRMATNRK